VRLHDLAHDGEAEPRAGQAAGPARPVEAVEHVGEVIRVDTGPVVADGELAVAHADLDGLVGRAPLSGVVEQVAHGALEPRPVAHHERRLRAQPHLARGSQTLGDSGHDLVEAHRLALVQGRLALAGELDQVGHEAGELLELATDARQQLLAVGGAQPVGVGEQLHARPQGGERGAQLVRSIRDELAARGHGVLERVEHDVEVGREPTQLVVGRRADAPGEVAGAGDVLRRGRQPGDGHEGDARHGDPQRGGEREAGEGDDAHGQAEPPQGALQRGEREHRLHRAVVHPRHEPPHGDLPDPAREGEVIPPSLGDRAHGRTDGQVDRRVGRADHHPVRADELGVAHGALEGLVGQPEHEHVGEARGHLGRLAGS